MAGVHASIIHNRIINYIGNWAPYKPIAINGHDKDIQHTVM